MAMTYSEFNLDDAVRDWASGMYQASLEHDNDDTDSQLKYQLDYSRVRFSDSSPEYHSTRGVRQSDPKTEVLHEAVMKNDTARNQQFFLDVERETTSVGRINVTKGLVYNGKTRLNLENLPKEIPAGSGFGRKLAVEEIESQEFKEKIKWKINTRVTVPRLSKVKAEVLVNQNTYEANYSVITEISGNIHVDVVNPHLNNALVKSIDGDVFEVLRSQRENVVGLSFDKSRRSALFKSTAACIFRFGVTEVINVTPQ